MVIMASYISHPLLKENAIESRLYQQVLAADVLKKGNTMVVAPTALGKTIVAILVAADRLQKVKNRTIVLPKLGCVKIRGYRNLKEFPFRIINATVSKVANKYYVSVVVEEDIKSKYAKTYHIVGIDLGIKSLVTTSSFESYGNVSSLKKHEKRIAILQQKLAKKISSF